MEHNKRCRTNSSERERSNRSVFNRLGDNSRSHSPIRFHNDFQILPPTQTLSRDSSLDPVRIVVQYSNENGYQGESIRQIRTTNEAGPQAEIIYSIRQLEQQNKDNMRHIQGVRMTVENYQREIYKLEKIVHETNQEIERLKGRMHFMM